MQFKVRRLGERMFKALLYRASNNHNKAQDGDFKCMPNTTGADT